MRTAKYLAFTALLAGAVTLGAVDANAEGTKAGANVSSSKFKSLDSDMNGVLNESEYNSGAMGGSFTQLDANSDGNLTLSELRVPNRTRNSATGSDATAGTSANPSDGTSGLSPNSSGSTNRGRQ